VETLRFTASCRLPHNVDKKARVQQILELMDLENYANFVIGREQVQ
jgi:ABC-type multidrug transport system ATPase subunit